MFALAPEQDQAGAALYCAHVPRREPAALASSFTSLRRAPHRPDPASVQPVGRANASLRDKAMGWPAQRSKGGGTGRRRVPGDMSGAGHPVALSRVGDAVAVPLAGREGS
jgi:hypothetical protein